ncbi:MAG: hypothetical protein R6U30_10095 [Halomonas sp.]|uniref:hypothetical protein n=1 Tax=Halomonas sp. TaxID=1486246 RepID=UPI003970DE2B
MSLFPRHVRPDRVPYPRRCGGFFWLAGGFVALGALLLIWLRAVDQTARRLDAEAKAAPSG